MSVVNGNGSGGEWSQNQDYGLSTWDVLAVVLYFALVLGVGLMSMFRHNRGTVSGYFLAGRYMFWLPVGASLFASNIGSEHFIGLAGSGAASGIGVGAFEFNVCTLPEYMNKRFGGQRIRVYLACLSLLLYIFTKISVNLYSGALFIEVGLGWDLYSSVLALLLFTGFFTFFGGLAAVIYTDTLQFFIMIIGALIVMGKSFYMVGGYEQLVKKYMEAIPSEHNLTEYKNTSCGLPREDSFVMLRHPISGDIPWPAFILGQTPASIWYWCADQMMVQRVLSAKSLSHAQGGTLFAGYFKILPLFLMVLPGMISRVFYTDDIACISPEKCQAYCGNPVSCTNMAYPRLILEIMPPGMRGVMMAVMLAALMSDLTSIFNSASTLFAMDIWKIYRPRAKNTETVWGAFWGLMVGFCMGATRMVLDSLYREPACYEEDTRPLIVSKVHYMYFAMILFWSTIIVAIVVSLLTDPLESHRVVRTVYVHRFDKERRPDDGERPEHIPEEEFHITELQNTAERQDELDSKVEKEPRAAWKKLAKRLYNWFMGFEEGVSARHHLEELEAHLQKITSLHQTFFEKVILNANLILISGVCIGLFIYFSIDPVAQSAKVHL
ncbi:unnamed protein product [Darwinula stevensoni]|uniref:Sodium/myo-inositol cotransporter n=1 Tax=Darwinula stevensoni TaxID=69355 RepID=A0A7R9A870_9CRUS|nr:unnamed protein product [Darwinula stevensoni]CAG0895970.1 unnamed protein product [Darwinula stevensoni]